MKKFYILIVLVSIVKSQALSDEDGIDAPFIPIPIPPDPNNVPSRIVPVNTVPSCFINEKVKEIRKLLCHTRFSCETKYYYMFEMNLADNSECVVSNVDYDEFEVWNTCPEIHATYTAQKFNAADRNKCFYSAVNA